MDKVQTELTKQLEVAYHELASTILERQVDRQYKPNYSDQAFQNALLIFFDVAMDKLYDKLKEERQTMEQMSILVEAFALELRETIKKHLGIDTHKLFDK